MNIMGRRQQTLEMIIGLLLIIAGYLLYWWSTSLLWILIYPPPFEKQLISIFSFLLIVLGILLVIDGFRRFIIECKN
jgi:hypothetical protein